MPYDAFISYSHAGDAPLATRLQSALHRIGKPWYRLRSLHLYRDTTNLALNPDLWGEIERALGQSGAFIVLASPQSAASPWVQKEIGYWLAQKDRRRLFIVLTGGELAWNREAGDFDWPHTDALPRSLSGAFSAEPLWLDLRWARSVDRPSTHDPRFYDGMATLAAALLGRPKDELIGEDVRQRRNTRRTVIAVIAALCVTTAVALWQRQVAAGRAYAAQALLAARDGHPDHAIDLAMKAANATGLLTGEARSALREVAYDAPGTRCVLKGHVGPITRVRLLDSKRAVTASVDGTLRLWALDVATRCPTLRRFEGHRASVADFDVSRDGQRMVSVSVDGQICLWDLQQDASPRCHDLPVEQVSRVAFSDDGKRVLVASKTAGLAAWDVERSAMERPFSNPQGQLLSLAVRPGGDEAATGSDEGRICLLELANGATRCCVDLSRRYPNSGVHDLAFAPNGVSLLAGLRGYPDGVSLVRLDASTCASGEVMKGHLGGWAAVAYSADGLMAASGTRDRTIVLWTVANSRELMRLRGHSGAITSVAMSDDGRTLLSGSDDGTARWWDLRRGAEEGQVVSDMGRWLAISDNGRYAVARGPEPGGHGLWLWRVDTEPAQKLGPMPGEMAVQTAVVTDDGDMVLLGDLEGRVRLWLPLANSLQPLAGGHAMRVTRVAVSSDRKLLLSAAYTDEKVKDFGQPLLLWDLITGKVLRSLAGQHRIVRDVALSADGRHALSGSDDGVVRLWDVASGQEMRRFDAGAGEVWAVAFDRQAARIASGHQDMTARVWSAATGEELLRLAGHTGEVRSVAFDPGGTHLLTASADGTVRLWDTDNGREIGRFPGHVGEVRGVAFRGSGGRVVSFGDDLTLRWWRLLTSERLVDWVCANRYTHEGDCKPAKDSR